MKKLYALLLGLLVIALCVTTQNANAQYTPSNYNVIVNGDPWVPLSGGTTVAELIPQTTNGDFFTKAESFSNEISLPFNFRLVNLLSNKIKISGEGAIVVGGSSTVADNITQDFLAYEAYYQDYYYYNSGSYYIEGCNNQIMGWEGASFPIKGVAAVTYATAGTAPNRTFTVEIDGWGNYPCAYDAGYGQTALASAGPDYISYQYVLYEGSSFISKFQINYGPYVPNYNGSNSASYCYDGCYYGFGGVVTGVRMEAGNFINVQLTASMPAVGTNLNTYGWVQTYQINSAYQFYTTGPNRNLIFAIRFPYNLAFDNPSPTPADQLILLINTPITPSVKITNEGANAMTSASVNCTITENGFAAPVYNQTVALSGATLPGPNGLTGAAIVFPNYTPTTYGLYTVTYSLVASNPQDQYSGDDQFVTSFVVSPPNNVASIVALLPAPNSRTPVGYATPITFRYRNLGVNNQFNVPVSTYITNPQGAVVYRDTVVIPSWSSTPGQQIRDTTFKDWIPQSNGTYTLCGVTLLTTDQNHADDTICAPVIVRYLSDVKAVAILNPDDQEEKPEKKRFQPQATFQSVGVQDLFDVKARCEIHRCSDNTVVFRVDSTIPELNTDAGAVKFSFPSNQGTNDIAKLAPGCYYLCAIAMQSDDGDRSNDTICQYFGIIPRLQGTIQVGVGRRFQTISAAVDSMRFRGIGGNLTLQLTDASYTENGNTSVSTPFAAVDFANILGTGPTAIVKWVPLANVFPVITFTGNKQYCFSYEYLSANYVYWDGNNQQAPTTDLVVAEPNKRGISIVNQSTTVGSVFRLAHGRNNLGFKNLNVTSNGNLTNAASRAFSIQNVYDFNSYFLQHVIDTSEIHNITVDNCFIGNANTGISDSGTVPLFDVGNAIYFNHRNFNNRFSRNTIGSQSAPIGAMGVQISNEDGLAVDRNEISWITGNSTTSGYAAAVTAINGNSVNLMLNGNKVHNIKSPNLVAGNTIAGFDIQQSSTVFVTGNGPNARTSTVPTLTGNRITNNFLYDMRTGTNPASVVPMRDMTVGLAAYTVQNDSIFNNSIAVANAQFLIQVNHVINPFFWNNILQNLNTANSATAVLYNITMPRPMFQGVSSNYNLIDFRNATSFANMNEYDGQTGVSTYSVTVPNLNAWRTMAHQDVLSVTGDPMFTTDSLHLPIATTYIYTPAGNNGKWLGTATQAFDIDGDGRQLGGSSPDIGADEFDGFQFTNDLTVKVITQPSGITDNTGITQVTAGTPLAIQAIVQNVGSILAANRIVTVQVDSSTNNGLTWIPMQTVFSSPTNFNVGEAKTMDFVGPNISRETGKLFRVTVSTANDQYNANNSVTKIFKITVERRSTLLAYNSSTLKGRQNKDSLAAALQRLSVPYDSLDRNSFGPNLIDYSPWWTLVWAEGDPTTAYASGLGIGSISLKEEQEIINYLSAGQTYAKKSFVVAGQNIAQYLDTAASNTFKNLNNVVTDGEFMLGWMHTRYVNQYPGRNDPPALPIQYRGLLKGTGLYFVFADSIVSGSPDVVRPTPVTGTVGTNTSRFAYFYTTHPSTPTDSGAGTAWNGAVYNVVFYGFDWADAIQTVGLRDGETLPVNVSGTTRFLRGALDFIKSFGGTVLPVEFTAIKGEPKTDGNLITWSVAGQKDVDQYEVELLGSDNTWGWAGTVKAANVTDYSFLHTAESALETGKTYTYRVEGVNLDGSRNTSNTVNVERSASGAVFSVEQNYPNPFGTSTVIGYSLPSNGTVSLRVLDLTGKTVGTDLVSTTAGKHSFKFTTNDLASGSYIYEVTFTDAAGLTSVERGKMTLNK